MKIMLSLFSICLTISFLSAQQEYKLDERYTINQGGLFSLDTEDATVTITGSDRNDVSVKIFRKVTGKHYSNNKFELQIEERDGDLFIKEVKDRKGMNYTVHMNGKMEYTIDVVVPNRVALDLKGDDDDYKIRHINGNLKIAGEDGDIHLENINSDRAKINSEDGDVILRDFAGSLVLNNEDGDFKSHNSFYEDLDVEIEDGSIKIHNGSIANCNIETEDGDINIDASFDAQANINIVSDDGNININAAGHGGTYTIKFEDGDVDYTKSEFKLTNDSKRYRSLKTTRDGSVEVNIKVEDGDVDLSHKS